MNEMKRRTLRYILEFNKKLQYLHIDSPLINILYCIKIQ